MVNVDQILTLLGLASRVLIYMRMCQSERVHRQISDEMQFASFCLSEKMSPLALS